MKPVEQTELEAACFLKTSLSNEKEEAAVRREWDRNLPTFAVKREPDIFF